MKLAIVFPGQGSQSVGMLRGYEDVPEVVQFLLEAKEALGEPFVRLLEEGSFLYAGANALLNVLICIVFAALGIFLARF